jgi:GDPmannose 4,6-dehydratase
MKTAILTGITGQDGSYLSELLLNNGYRVVGIVRSYNKANLSKLEYLNIKDAVSIEECDLTDIPSIVHVINKFKPDEIYNLAAQSSVGLSFEQPIGTISFNTISVINILECIRLTNPAIRFYQASSSEMYGKVSELPVTEKTPMHPLSPYAISKAAAYWSVINYRESYGLYACNGVLFNHESFLRDNNFFVKKVIRSAVEISRGKKEFITVGNIDIKRDFGFAPDYVKAMWLILQQQVPEDYLICSGTSISLRSVIEHVFSQFKISFDKIRIDNSLFRPTDIEDIYGDNSKAQKKLNWNYETSFYTILDRLIEEELKNLN